MPELVTKMHNSKTANYNYRLPIPCHRKDWDKFIIFARTKSLAHMIWFSSQVISVIISWPHKQCTGGSRLDVHLVCSSMQKYCCSPNKKYIMYCNMTEHEHENITQSYQVPDSMHDMFQIQSLHIRSQQLCNEYSVFCACMYQYRHFSPIPETQFTYNLEISTIINTLQQLYQHNT